MEVALAVLACECVESPDKTGFGGGLVAMIYRHETKLVETLIATERSHIRNISKEITEINQVGVPGLLKGMWEMYTRYDTTKPWKSLLQGAYKVAESYAIDNRELINKFKKHEHAKYLILSKTLRDSLKTLIDHEPKEFYEGELGRSFVKDVNLYGGNMKISDLKEYE